MVCTFLMPLIWEEGERCHKWLWGKVIAQQLMSFTIVLNKMMLNRYGKISIRHTGISFLQHYCEELGRLNLSLEGGM